MLNDAMLVRYLSYVESKLIHNSNMLYVRYLGYHLFEFVLYLLAAEN